MSNISRRDVRTNSRARSPPIIHRMELFPLFSSRNHRDYVRRGRKFLPFLTIHHLPAARNARSACPSTTNPTRLSLATSAKHVRNGETLSNWRHMPLKPSFSASSHTCLLYCEFASDDSRRSLQQNPSCSRVPDKRRNPLAEFSTRRRIHTAFE